MLQVRVVRIFNTYGPRMALDDGRVVSNFVAQALTGTPLTIYGHGEQTRSFQYVSDLIEGGHRCILLSHPSLLPWMPSYLGSRASDRAPTASIMFQHTVEQVQVAVWAPCA